MTEASPEKPTWVDLIGYLGELRQELAQLHPDVLPMTVPHPAATREQLTDTETVLGHRLDEQHAELLRVVNGWPYMFLDLTLLGTDDLANGTGLQRGRDLLDIFYSEGAAPEDFPAKEDLDVLAVSSDQNDVVVVWRRGANTDGGLPVSWLVGEEIERYDNVFEYLADVVRRAKRQAARAEP